ncbi:MAG TPA: metalloregulator ArsR/SmtB family transcription factor [Armatimonadota bacterium]|jgi:DNA-binding transcriptional ArsR family regulator
MESIARLARALSDDTRLRLLRALMEGEATPNELAQRLGLTHPRAANHLAALRDVGLASETVSEERRRAYSVDADAVGALLAAMEAAAVVPHDPHAPSAGAAREIRRNSPIRQARTCYDHLGGLAGVEILDAMVERGWLTPDGPRPIYLLTLEGGRALAERGVDLPEAGRRSFAFGCMDWTERRPHLGGALGAAILRALLEQGIVRRQPGIRAVTLSNGMKAWLGA